MTKHEVFRVLVVIESVYSYCSVKDETVINWFRQCSNMDFEKVMQRLILHIRRSPYPPSMDELLECNNHNSWLNEYIPRKG